MRRMQLANLDSRLKSREGQLSDSIVVVRFTDEDYSHLFHRAGRNSNKFLDVYDNALAEIRGYLT